MRSLILGVTITLLGCTAASTQTSSGATKALVKSYLEVQNLLASDKFAELKAPARALVKDASVMGKDGEAVAKTAAAVEAAPDIAAAREAFGPLSDAIIARVRADGSKEVAADLKLAYCPMVKRSWIQREPQIRNPYYGASMLACGELKPIDK